MIEDMISHHTIKQPDGGLQNSPITINSAWRIEESYHTETAENES